MSRSVPPFFDLHTSDPAVERLSCNGKLKRKLRVVVTTRNPIICEIAQLRIEDCVRGGSISRASRFPERRADGVQRARSPSSSADEFRGDEPHPLVRVEGTPRRDPDQVAYSDFVRAAGDDLEALAQSSLQPTSARNWRPRR